MTAETQNLEIRLTDPTKTSAGQPRKLTKSGQLRKVRADLGKKRGPRKNKTIVQPNV